MVNQFTQMNEAAKQRFINQIQAQQQRKLDKSRQLIQDQVLMLDQDPYEDLNLPYPLTPESFNSLI